MASETVIPEQSSTKEQVEKIVNEEVKAVEQESLPVSKENVEDVEEKPKTEQLANPEVTVIESTEKTEDKEINPPAIVAIEKGEKIDNIPVLDVEVDTPKAIEDANSTQVVTAVSEPLVESVEKEPEHQPKISDSTSAEVEAVHKPVEEVPLTPEPEEVPTPVAEVEAVDKPIEEVPPTAEPEEVLVSESKIVEKPEAAVEAEEKAPEKSEVTTEVETKSELIEHNDSVVDEIAKDAGFLVKKAEEVTESPMEEQTDKDQAPVAAKSVDTLISTNQDAQSDKKDREVSVIPDVVEQVDVEDSKKEETQVDVIAGVVKEEVLEVPKVEEEKEEKDAKVETENEEKKEEVQESKEPETAKSEDVSGSNSATEVTEKSLDGEKVSIVGEVVPEEKKEEIVKDVAKASVETSKDRDVEEKPGAVDSTTTVTEPVGEPRELVLEAKTKDTVETVVDKLETAAEVVEEIAKSDAPDLESSKDVTNSKTEVDLPKQDIPAKATQKHSNNIMSKVKQSIVKVKKAIIGRSPSSKTITSDAKDDIQVK